jgi:HSP20 family molecular chaperone IbpA
MFSRTVPLPPTTVPDKLTAEMKNGVLEVHIPMERKKEPVKQTIPVK